MPVLALTTALLLAGAEPSSIRVRDDSGAAVAPFAIQPARPTVLLYVLPECPIAAKFSPEIARLVRDYPKARFFLVNVDRHATASQAKAHRTEFRLPCPELLDPKGDLVRLGKPEAVPTAVLFDSSGRIKYHGRIDDRFPTLGTQRSAPTRHDLRIALNEVLTGKPVSMPTTSVVGCSVPRT